MEAAGGGGTEIDRRPSPAVLGLAVLTAASASIVLFVVTRMHVSIGVTELSVVSVNFESSIQLYLAIMLTGIALASVGRWRTFWVPAVVYACLPLIAGGPADGYTTFGQNGPGSLVAITTQAEFQKDGWPAQAPLWAVLLELGLALLPGACMVLMARRSGRPASTTGVKVRRSDVVAVAALAALSCTVVAYGHPGWLRADAAIWVPVFLFGMLLGTHRPSWLWTVVAVSLLWSPGYQVRWELLAVAVLAVVADRLGSLIGRIESSLSREGR
jgi:hypothetical protein